MRYLSIAAIVCLLYLVGTSAATATTKRWNRLYPRWWHSAALCLHSHEGSWQDPNAPYYGGMQMDWGFMRHYGGWILRHHGTADHWPIRTQILVAYRGYRRQGFGAWPVTSRLCGFR